jgi:undecaprenyl-diphosphatase
VFLDRTGTVFMIDFGFSELAAEDLLLETDVAELLASSATVVGARRALDVARSVVGPEVLSTAGQRLVPSRLSGATRTTMKGLPGCLEELRAGAVAGADAVQLDRIEDEPADAAP